MNAYVHKKMERKAGGKITYSYSFYDFWLKEIGKDVDILKIIKLIFSITDCSLTMLLFVLILYFILLWSTFNHKLGE